MKGEYNSRYGSIISEWSLKGDVLQLQITIPANALATIYVPTSDVSSVTESGKATDKAEAVRFQNIINGKAVYHVGSGSYSFQSKISK